MSSIEDEEWALVANNGDIALSHNSLSDSKSIEPSASLLTALPMLSALPTLPTGANINEMVRRFTEMQIDHKSTIQKHVSGFAEVAAQHSAAILDRARQEAQRVLSSFQIPSEERGDTCLTPEPSPKVFEVVRKLATYKIPVFTGQDFNAWLELVDPYIQGMCAASAADYLHITRLWSVPEVAVEIERELSQMCLLSLPVLRERIHDLCLQRQLHLAAYQEHLDSIISQHEPITLGDNVTSTKYEAQRDGDVLQEVQC